MINNKTLYQLKEERLHVLFGKVVSIPSWNSRSLLASFWRCYCPLESGGEILFQGETIPLAPGKGYVIPKLTDFQSRSDKPFTKVFGHFSYETQNVWFSPGVYEFSLPKDVWDKVSQLKGGSKVSLDIELLMLQLISMGLAAIPDVAKHELLVDARIQSLVDFIHENKTSGITNADLADQAKLTIPSMIRLFNKSMGVSPQKYVKDLRLQHAGSLLVHTDNSLEEIAEECCFWDRNHFTRAFTRYFTLPPATYRKLNRG